MSCFLSFVSEHIKTHKICISSEQRRPHEIHTTEQDKETEMQDKVMVIFVYYTQTDQKMATFPS